MLDAVNPPSPQASVVSVNAGSDSEYSSASPAQVKLRSAPSGRGAKLDVGAVSSDGGQASNSASNMAPLRYPDPGGYARGMMLGLFLACTGDVVHHPPSSGDTA